MSAVLFKLRREVYPAAPDLDHTPTTTSTTSRPSRNRREVKDTDRDYMGAEETFRI